MKKRRILTFAMLLCSSIAMWSASSPFRGNEITEGTWWLYNVESGKCLGNNNDLSDVWTTRAQVNTVGLNWVITPIEGDGWQMNPRFGHNHSLNGGEARGYLDTDLDITTLTFEQVECDGSEWVYKISSGSAL